MADLLNHGGDVSIAGRFGFNKPGLEALVGAIEIDPIEEDTMRMPMPIDSTSETLDKGDRSRLDVGSREASGDGFVHIILSDRGADDAVDGVDLRGQFL